MAKIRVVAIERQYCSGGSTTGKRAAELLGVPCYDREIVDMAAEKLGLTSEEILKYEEAVLGLLKTPLSLKIGHDRKLDITEQVFAAEAEIITELAKKGSCVIVGRCAGYILKNVTRTLRVYIYADQESRAARAVNEHGIPYAEVDSRLKRYDKKRGDFFNTNTRMNWSCMLTYDVCFNSGVMGTEGCARAICDIVNASK